MNRYSITIAVLDCDEIKQYFEKVKPVERLTMKLQTVDVTDVSSYNDADVIIMSEHVDYKVIQEVFQNKASFAEVIMAVVDFDHFEIPDLDFVGLFYDIWNINNPIIEYRIYSFAKRMRDTLDKELCEKQLVTLIDSIPDLVWYKDIRESHMSVNQSFCETVGKTKEQIKDRGHCYIWDLDPAEYEQGEYVCMETEDVVIEEQGTFLFDEKVKIRDEMRQLKTYKSAIVGRRGETIGTVGIARDVTDIWNSHEEFQTLISRLPYAIVIVDVDYKFVSCNERFEKLFGRTDVIMKDADIDEMGQYFFGEDVSRRDEENTSIKVSMIVDTQEHYYEIDKQGIHDMFDKLSGYFYIVKDETDTFQYEEKLKELSVTDELTKLYNRKAIRNYFDMNKDFLFHLEHSMAICMLDLDYFKGYNDFYGHVAGDKVLYLFGKILRDVKEEYNVFVARYGGEEFLLIANNKSVEEMTEIAEVIMSKLHAYSLEHEKSKINDYVTVSIGIAYYESSYHKQVSEVVAEADQALYKAKTSGRNCYVLEEIK
ncbi:MAG: sensor domain-containing diguanylate cyclase [Eubacteriales bacterium]